MLIPNEELTKKNIVELRQKIINDCNGYNYEVVADVINYMCQIVGSACVFTEEVANAPENQEPAR